MGYSVDVIGAMELAKFAHNGKVDKSGVDYINHPLRVAFRMETSEEKVVAWLHDVVEDCDEVGIDDIYEKFGNETGDAVKALTRGKDETYNDYLKRVKGNEVATKVKISDLIDNSNLSRLKKVTLEDIERQKKYNRALKFLMGA